MELLQGTRSVTPWGIETRVTLNRVLGAAADETNGKALTSFRSRQTEPRIAAVMTHLHGS